MQHLYIHHFNEVIKLIISFGHTHSSLNSIKKLQLVTILRSPSLKYLSRWLLINYHVTHPISIQPLIQPKRQHPIQQSNWWSSRQSQNKYSKHLERQQTTVSTNNWHIVQHGRIIRSVWCSLFFSRCIYILILICQIFRKENIVTAQKEIFKVVILSRENSSTEVSLSSRTFTVFWGFHGKASLFIFSLHIYPGTYNDIGKKLVTRFFYKL